MKTITNIYHYVVFIFILLTISILFMVYMQPVAFAEPAVLPDGELTGWGWTDTFGWVSLNCINVYAGENDAQLTRHCASESYSDYAVELDPETGVMDGFAWSTNAGWIDFSPTIGAGSVGSLPTISGGDNYAHTVQLDVESRYLEGWAVATFNDTDPNNNAWIRFRAAEECNTVDPDETNYCVRLNEHGYLAGWAWSGGDDGLGWIYFDETFSGGPYIKTQYSDIYSGGTVTGSRAPEGAYNATYCIISGSNNDITLSSSKSCLIGGIDIDFPTASESYSTSIVQLDVDYLEALSKANNKYYDVDSDTYNITELPNNNSLAGNVYYFTSTTRDSVDFNINSSLDFDDAITGSGAGTIVIDGDLYINAKTGYGSGVPDNLNEIASVSWVVLGDVYINKSVSSVVGAFVVLGNGTAGSGKFYTGDDDGDAVETKVQLDFSGVVVAKEIILERTYFSSLSPSEIFEYDGRVLLNTPPGLGNFVGYLPEWSR
ncbi:MAG: hypothetical protein ACKKL6_03405 [Candidatus Komeilibacteria bacterium]